MVGPTGWIDTPALVNVTDFLRGLPAIKTDVVSSEIGIRSLFPILVHLEGAILGFSRARAQSTEADGARARNRTVFFEHDYEQEHEHEQAWENIAWGSERLQYRNLKTCAAA
jgi:hypothetical protein